MMENKNRFYVLNGVVYPLEDTKPSEYIIGSAADLATLTGVIFPGSIARIAGTKNWYEMKPNGEWSEAHNEEKDDFAPDISNPQDGDTLVYDATAGVWKNGVGGGGGGGGSLIVKAIITVEQETPIMTLDKTWQEIRDAVDDGEIVNIIMDTSEGQRQETQFLQILSILYAPGNVHPYSVSISIPGGEQVFELNTDSASGYPTTGLTS